MFKSALEVNTAASISLAAVAAVASVVAFTYYAGVIKRMWLEDPADLEIEDETRASGGLLIDKRTSIVVTPALRVAIITCEFVTILLGVMPGIISKVGELIVLVK